MQNYTLITSLGTFPMQQTTYVLGDCEAERCFSAAALPALLDAELTRAVVLLTPEARRANWESFAHELEEHTGIKPEARSIQAGRSEADVWSLLEDLAAIVEPGEHIVLEVTNSLRYLPFVYFASLNYLRILRNASVDGIYYGAYERDQPRTPVVNLTALIGLSDWYYALRVFTEAGSLAPIDALLQERRKELFAQRTGDAALLPALNGVRRLVPFLASGLPLEAGSAALDLVTALDTSAAVSAAALQAGAHAVSALHAGIAPLAAASAAHTKEDLQLDTAEQQRQLRLIRWYATHGDLPTAFLILREWVVSQVLLANGMEQDWIDGRHGGPRERAERALGALQVRSRRRAGQRDPAQPSSEPTLVGLWSGVSGDRNLFAHAGYQKTEIKPKNLEAIGRRLEEYLQIAEARLRDEGKPFWSIQLAGMEGTLLVAPLGRLQGALFSALKLVDLNRLIVLTSAEVESELGAILAAAGRPDLEPLVIAVQDPVAGFDEIRARVGDERIRQLLLEAERVVVSVTGGSTALQYAVERIRDEAQELGVPVRRVALVDRRPREYQERDPYRVGELYELDSDTKYGITSG